ncbi:MAG TPA: hypothetical protein VNT60_04555 [Deinococcales bacterium]|nr:hypothetical protein [Deinococcales bacterium]
MDWRMIRVAYYRPPPPWGADGRARRVERFVRQVLRDEFGAELRVLVIALELGPPCLRPARASGNWEGHGRQAEAIALAALRDALDAEFQPKPRRARKPRRERHPAS